MIARDAHEWLKDGLSRVTTRSKNNQTAGTNSKGMPRRVGFCEFFIKKSAQQYIARGAFNRSTNGKSARNANA
jgi:hypothetical protein